MLKTVISFMNNLIWYWMCDGEIACGIGTKAATPADPRCYITEA